MSVSAQDVKKLRDMTGVGFMDCKAALAETEGDLEEAVKLLREKGKAKAAKKAARTATEGLIKAHVAADAQKGTLVEVSCNTDFVARNPEFGELVSNLTELAAREKAGSTEALNAAQLNGKQVSEVLVEKTATIGENIQVGRVVQYATEGTPGVIEAYIHPPGKIGVLVHVGLSDASLAQNDRVRELARDLCLHIAASVPVFVSPETVDATVLEAEKDIYRKQALNEGKPEQIAERIVEGRIKKFYEESTLLKQPFVKDNDVSVEKLIAQVGKDVGGQIEVRRFARIAVGENVPSEAEEE